MRARHLAAALGAALLAGMAPGTALAGDPIMPLSELRPGMQCTGYWVIRGTEISAFDVEIMDIVSGDAWAKDGPRILIRVSGDAVDRAGVGPGFSGSPIYCDGQERGRDLRAIGDSGGTTGWRRHGGDPRQPDRPPRGKPVARPPKRACRPRAAAGRAADGLRPQRRDRGAAGCGGRSPPAGAGAHRGRHAARPLTRRPPRPGSAMSVGYSSGDLAVGAVGTVAYVDGDRVWGFGHPFERSACARCCSRTPTCTGDLEPERGRRHRLDLQARRLGHDLGTISNDASAAGVGRAGAPPPTAPVRIFSEDEDTGARDTLAARVVDETDAGTPTGGSALSLRRAARARAGHLGGPAQRPRQADRHASAQIRVRERK